MAKQQKPKNTGLAITPTSSSSSFDRSQGRSLRQVPRHAPVLLLAWLIVMIFTMVPILGWFLGPLAAGLPPVVALLTPSTVR